MIDENIQNYNEIDMETNIIPDDHVDDSQGYVEEDYSKYNQIDMECNYADDTETFECEKLALDSSMNNVIDTNNVISQTYLDKDPWGIVVDFSDDEPIKSKQKETSEDIKFEDKELVDSDVIQEGKKSNIDQGKVEADYWKNLAKQHKKTNVKGAYNLHFHFAGDPTKEMEMFNHDMGIDSSATTSGNITGTASSAEGGVSESIATQNNIKEENYNNSFNDLLSLIGFKRLESSDPNKIVLQDLYDTNSNIVCRDKSELKECLSDYIDVFFIYPLQAETQESFNTCKEWCDWYSEDIAKKYPNCKEDIGYCDLIANHWDEINI